MTWGSVVAVRTRKLEAARRRLHRAMIRLEPYDGGPVPERAAYWAERETREALKFLEDARSIEWGQS